MYQFYRLDTTASLREPLEGNDPCDDKKAEFFSDIW
jgi:hypothetical protein